jgi:protein-disulfide isomerase
MEFSLNRNVLLAAIVIVVAAIGAWFYGQRQGGTPAPDGTVVTLDEKADLMQASPLGENMLGKEDAPVTIIEYASTTCPHCANFHKTTFPELKKRYIDTGQVRFIYREFPLNEPDFIAYMLSRCMPKDKFFPFLETLFEQQEKWAVQGWQAPLKNIASQAGFNEETFNACLQNKQVQEGVAWQSKQGSKLGVNSTPTFFINGQKYSGGMSIEEMEKVIAPLLKS